jgi:hypothetical protein
MILITSIITKKLDRSLADPIRDKVMGQIDHLHMFGFRNPFFELTEIYRQLLSKELHDAKIKRRR